jgi:hypothetical protein
MIICSSQFTNILRKSFETMLDGSERCMIKMTPAYLELQSVDSLAVCSCLFRFMCERFIRYDIVSDFSIKINIRPLYNFLKKQPIGSMIIDKQYGTLFVSVKSKTNEVPNHFKLLETDDCTVYYDITTELFSVWPCFRINPEEFTGIILDLAVGGGYTDLHFNETSVLLRTTFETGSISIEAHGATKDFSIIRGPPDNIHNRYLTKFLKQACTIAPTCIDMCIFIKPNGPLVMVFTLENNVSKFIMTIAPVG